MKLLIFYCLFTTLPQREAAAQMLGGALRPKVESLDGVENYWFKQILDHNNAATPTYWDQRYSVNQIFWKKTAKSPIFLRIEGENNMSDGWMSGGSWYIWANKYGALLLQLEHRFYGQSHPTQDTSTGNLQYLSSEQAISDIQYFIEQMNSKYNLNPSTNKWILFGGSYAGNLVAWARLKLPNHVYGSISSSGPYQATINFYQYDEIIRYSLDTFSPGCSNQLTRAIQSIQSQFRTTAGIQNIKNKFGICDGFNPNDPRDVKSFIEKIFGPIRLAVQYNNQDKSQINFVCSYLNNPNVQDPVDRLAQLWNANKDEGCLNAIYQRVIAYYQSISWNSPAVTTNVRQWLYQTCNEFGFFQTSETTNSLLSNTLDIKLFYQQCTDIFGSNFNSAQLDQAVKNTNQYYGGTAIQVDRVVFVQGSLDPWHVLGMVQNSTQSPLIYILGTSHCQDMFSPQSTDLPTLTDGRKKIESYLYYWLYS